MKIAKNITDVRQLVQSWKAQRLRVAFVPTMGNLHAGHLSLVGKAREIADKVVVSIYVNPMQFGAGEDFDTYPRTFDADSEKLIEAGADLLFLPSTDLMYADSVKASTQVYVPELTEILCGESRPGHFLGVSTIVNKLFNVVQPDVAIFGQKDFQQVIIIRRMVADLLMPVKIIALPTSREPDGLAMSSRNQYLGADERKVAPKISKLMNEMSDLVSNGADITDTEAKGVEALASAGFKPEYFSFRDPDTLAALEQAQTDMVLLVAAKLGSTRLIDNCLFSLRTAV